MVNFARSALLSALATVEVFAHPGEDHKAEAAKRMEQLTHMKTRGLGACASHLEARGHKAAAAARRQAVVSELTKRTLATRDYPDVLNVTHHSNLTVTPETDPSILFAGNASCSLVPEVTQGPYYVTGELMRSNVTEDQVGVPLYLDIQVIDTNTCEPLEGVALDYWHCNATGDYSGISSQAGLNTTWLRGIQATDEQGVATFQSIVPGHYTGRTHHLHLLAHSPGEWELLANGTITGGESTPHIGQAFFDQDLVNELETLEPYASNTQSWTKNDEDHVLTQEALATGVDPVVDYVLLGDSLSDGVFAWVSMGIDPTDTYYVSSAVEHTEDGGIENACFQMINLATNDPTSGLPAPPTTCVQTATATRPVVASPTTTLATTTTTA
ncbi:Intradiol ring-cleavage dioxygenase [Xylariaceae sp. FL0804]|nr:Intradiol ring-cleavage dioxygenase [Xylariaceae sp. FL0804]